ncbi:MAG: hypothetical protein CSA65_01465 [Proteobacteria bacterium]|nr:MAG: hypothetical protein CSB49_03135 [Pseudomonadota bacterium]PIE19680.1 MAG: hypothetical protein CSA65_01465 [Pseudomonadota bacterium]
MAGGSSASGEVSRSREVELAPTPQRDEDDTLVLSPGTNPNTPAPGAAQPAASHAPSEAAPDGPLSLSAEVDTTFTMLHGFLSQELDQTPEEGEERRRAELLYELGHLEELVSGDPARAKERYELAAGTDTTFIPALRALGRSYRKEGRWREVIEVLDAEQKATAGEDERAALATQIGALWWQRLDDGDAAVEALEQALSLDPKSRRALELLRQIYSRQSDWEPLFGVLGRLCNISTDDGERARLTVELAELAEVRLGREQEAEELYAHALELDSNNQKAALALRRLYLRHQRWQQLEQLLTQEAGREHEPDAMFSDMYRAARIAELYLRDDGRSASLLETAAALRPGDPLPLATLAEVYQRTGRYDEHCAVLERQLRLVRDPTQRAELHHRLGRLNQDWLSRPEQAAEAYREALSEKPDHEASLRALALLYRRLERWDDLFELELLRAERFRDEARRADGYLRAAILAERRLRDLRRAVDLYDRAWRLQPGLPEAFNALDRIYRDAKQWEPLAELYERKADLTDDTPLAVTLLRAVAEIYERRLDARERAIETLRKLQALMADDREALMHLARLYETSGRAEELRRTLATWAEVTEDARERTELLRRVGDLLDGPLRKTEAAIEIYQRILDESPGDRPTRERLKGIFERLGRWDDLVDTLQGELPELVEAERAPVELAIGRLCEDKLGEIARAEQAYEAALEADAEFTPAQLALEDLLKRQARWRPLVQLLTRQAEMMRGTTRAAAALCRAAEIEEAELAAPQRAEELFYRALELDPSCGPARQGLERLHLVAGDQAALESHYLREAEMATNPVLRVRAYLRLATLFDGAGDDTVGAAAAYESALKAIEDQPDALHALASLTRRTGKWDRLASLLGRIAATSDDRDAAVSALKEWASIVELHQSDRWDPEPIYQRVLDGDSHDAHALAALDDHAYRKRNEQALFSLAIRQIRESKSASVTAALCQRGATVLLAAGKLREAAEILRQGLRGAPTYLPSIRLLRRLDEDLEEWREAAQLLLREGELVRRQEARHSALARAGNILLDRFDEVDAARGAFARVFDEDPQNGACFGRLVEILAGRGEWRELVSLYDKRMAAVEGAARAPLQLQLAKIHRDNLHDGRAAITVLADLLSVDPQNLRARELIAELSIEQQRWREAEEHLERLADVAASDAERRRSALLQRAEILEQRLGEEEQALVVLRELLAAYPGEREALARCMAIYRRWGDWDRTVETLEELSRSGPPEERIDGLVDLAEIYSRTLGDADQARAQLRRATTICLETGAGIDRVSEYFERRGDFDGLVELWGQVLDELPPEGSPGAVAVRLARSRVLAGRLLRPAEAEADIRKALSGSPRSLEARLELAGLHLWGDNLAEASAEYLRVLDQDPFNQDAFRGLYRVHDRRGDLDRAAGAAQAICAVAEEAADSSEQKIAAQARLTVEAGLTSATTTPLGREGHWHLLAHPDEPQAARELLVAVADYLPQIVPEQLDDAHGGDIIPLDPEDALTSRCMLLAGILGVDKVEVCLGQQRGPGATALPGATPRLVVAERLASRASEPEFRFVVTRALVHVLTRSLYVAALPGRKVELILAAVVELFDRGFGAYLGHGPELDDLVRRINRAVPRRVRRSFEELARAHGSAGPLSIAKWHRASERSAERVGLLLCGDVKTALRVLRGEKASNKQQAELLRFVVGPHLYEARRRLGLSV